MSSLRTHAARTREASPASRAGVALAIMLSAQLMIILDATVVNIALPHILTSLHFSSTSLSWVMNGYTLTFGGLLLLGGRAGDILGRRRVFVAGIGLFTLASLVGGLSTSAGMLLAARAVQGAGGALAAPAVLALIVSGFPEGRERTRALGIYMGVITGGSSLGLVLGGVITEWLSWRWVLFINVPIGLLVLALTPLFVAETPRLPGRFAPREWVSRTRLRGRSGGVARPVDRLAGRSHDEVEYKERWGLLPGYSGGRDRSQAVVWDVANRECTGQLGIPPTGAHLPLPPGDAPRPARTGAPASREVRWRRSWLSPPHEIPG